MDQPTRPRCCDCGTRHAVSLDPVRHLYRCANCQARPGKPRGHEQADGSFVCEHRDLSCCPACLAKYDTLVDVVGAVFYLPDPRDRAAIKAQMAASAAARQS
jgi:hypothetical protein